ncbi:WD repeat-containing protein 53 isoform X1 [Amborella trichopoda]|uniref:WD repeat-containing protein 53 isoform X1 n=1 Tax=Amborella trichopoda TaxID=13333 RepID=UPI0005D313B4|nr:WD repeat-containing protein 53 isoform X1 [Amborella trichopoda]|eukprot:XP_011629364.1 WD repeat-containing protein 53 isoform X1 [Amborella trichopoda]
MEARKLRGHKATVLCCISSHINPNIIISSDEDGGICWFDIRCQDVVAILDVGKAPVASICFRPGKEDILYASSGSEIKSFDVHMASSQKPLETFNYNKEDINQIAVSFNSSFLAAADDSGDVKIIDIHQQCLYKTLRTGHTSICSSVQFLSWRPWEALTGGLDAKFVIWNFSRGRPCKNLDFAGMPDFQSKHSSSSNTGQFCNPAFVHAIAVPEETTSEKLGKVCAVARGDGVIDVIDIESELSGSKEKTHKSRSKSNLIPRQTTETSNKSQGKGLQLDYASGGHTAGVSCVAFSRFGEIGKFIVSGGNDASVKIWDWYKSHNNLESSCSVDPLQLTINSGKKVNWLCTTPNDSENVVVCDTSKIVKVYTVS